MIRSLGQDDFDMLTNIVSSLDSLNANTAFEVQMLASLKPVVINFRGLVLPRAVSDVGTGTVDLLGSGATPDIPFDPSGSGGGGSDSGGWGDFIFQTGD